MAQPTGGTRNDPTAGAQKEPDAESGPSVGTSRRSLLKGLAVAGAAVPLLAACGPVGTGDVGAPSDPRGQDKVAPDQEQSGPDILVAAAKVPVGGGVILVQPDTVVTQPTKGSFKGFSATCTHMGCILNNVSHGTINCICHGSEFDIATGKVVRGPATIPLPKKPISHRGPNIVAG